MESEPIGFWGIVGFAIWGFMFMWGLLTFLCEADINLDFNWRKDYWETFWITLLFPVLVVEFLFVEPEKRRVAETLSKIFNRPRP